jgi:hypothetical protein
MKTHKMIATVLSTMLVVLVASCGESTLTDTSVISGRIQNYIGGAATVEVIMGDTAVVAIGSLDASGNFSVDLPDSLGANTLFTVEKPCAEVAMTPETFKGAGFVLLSVVKDEKLIGFLFRASAVGAISSTTGKFIGWTYSDQAVALKGTCPAVGAFPSATFDIRYNQGWNLDEYDNAGTVRTVTATDLPWLFVDQLVPISLMAPSR